MFRHRFVVSLQLDVYWKLFSFEKLSCEYDTIFTSHHQWKTNGFECKRVVILATYRRLILFTERVCWSARDFGIRGLPTRLSFLPGRWWSSSLDSKGQGDT